MPLDWNTVIKDAESEFARALTRRFIAGLVTKIPWLAGLAGPLGFFVGLVIGQLVKYGDWLAYYLGDSWMNTEHGQKYQKAGEALGNLPATATKEELDAAKKAKQDAFDRLMGVP